MRFAYSRDEIEIHWIIDSQSEFKLEVQYMNVTCSMYNMT